MAKEKIFRSKKTGGGFGEQFSACNNLLLDKLKDTNVLTGIAGGVESRSYSFIIENALNLELVHVEGSSKTLHLRNVHGLQVPVKVAVPSSDEVPCVSAEKIQRKSRKRPSEVCELKKKRTGVELQFAQNRVAHENELFEIKKSIQKTLNKCEQ